MTQLIAVALYRPFKACIVSDGQYSANYQDTVADEAS
jgi:HJR/Mrr/RecB family endonuclease